MLLLLNHWFIVEMWPAIFCRYYFGRCSLELTRLNWLPLPFLPGRCTRYSDRLHDFSVTIAKCYKDFYVNSFFLCTARLWNSLPIECFSSTYNLNGFKSRINRHCVNCIIRINCRFFLKRSAVCFNLFPRSTQPFILPRLIKLLPGISGNLLVKSKLPPCSGSSLEAVEPHP